VIGRTRMGRGNSYCEWKKYGRGKRSWPAVGRRELLSGGGSGKVRNEIDNRELKSIAAWSLVTPVLGVASNRLNVPVPIQYPKRWDIAQAQSGNQWRPWP
jgi:hypothetical protein